MYNFEELEQKAEFMEACFGNISANCGQIIDYLREGLDNLPFDQIASSYEGNFISLFNNSILTTILEEILPNIDHPFTLDDYILSKSPEAYEEIMGLVLSDNPPTIDSLVKFSNTILGKLSSLSSIEPKYDLYDF